ncbi:MAG: hypothetical protein AB7G75_07355 [Candidatus Binatia bacterium]
MWKKLFLTGLLIVTIGCGAIGVLYRLHADAAIVAAILMVYGVLFWMKRKLDEGRTKSGYPIIRYRGHRSRTPTFSAPQKQRPSLPPKPHESEKPTVRSVAANTTRLSTEALFPETVQDPVSSETADESTVGRDTL